MIFIRHCINTAKNRYIVNYPYNGLKQFYNFTSTSGSSQMSLIDEVQAKVYQILHTAIKNPPISIRRGRTFEEIGLDSLSSLEVIVCMQEYFQVDLSNQEAINIRSVDSAVNTFFRHINAQVANKIIKKAKNDVEF